MIFLSDYTRKWAVENGLNDPIENLVQAGIMQAIQLVQKTKNRERKENIDKERKEQTEVNK